jgi:sulfate adenylyltransferase
LITPCGGSLVDLRLPAGEAEALASEATHLPNVRLTGRATCDLELLATGAFSPLDRFMGREDYQSCLDEMRLANGAIFPIPITLSVGRDAPVAVGTRVALRDQRNELLAVMTVEEVWEWDLAECARKVFGSEDVRHPLVAEMHRWEPLHIAGPIEVIQLPRRYDFQDIRMTPAQARHRLGQYGHSNVVAFQTRNPLHRVHEELTKRASQAIDGTLLLHPVVGLTKPGDVDHYTRVRAYKALAEKYYDSDRVLLALLPLAMRMAGPREAVWHALIRRNFGANHIIIGRDHAGPGRDSNGNPFYGPYDAQELVLEMSEELGMTMVPFKMVVYLPDEDRYEEIDQVASGVKTLSLSGTQVREDYLQAGQPLPAWFTRPEVAEILAERHPARHRRGVCIWLTGLPAAGKSTTANVLTVLLEAHGRQVSLLDGDVVRTNLSKGLGFSRDDRDANVRRIGFVTAEIVRHGGVVVCASASPYRSTRIDVRETVGADRFIEVYVDTPLAVCEARDPKGLYARARGGELSNFTGVDDPYEPPVDPEMTIETVQSTAEENATKILEELFARGFVRRP